MNVPSDMNNFLLKKVSCDGFLAKVKDGRFMSYDENHVPYACCSDGSSQESEEVDKTYYQFKESHFSGVIVGFKDVVVQGKICACYDDAIDVGVGTIPERYYFEKVPVEIKKCAIVYYANNLKHLVPIECLKEEE